MERRSVSGEPGALSGSSSIIDGDNDTKKLLHDYKFKLKKVEQENIILAGNVSRLDTQLTRFKTAAEEAEKLEDELKTEKRKILRDVSKLRQLVNMLMSFIFDHSYVNHKLRWKSLRLQMHIYKNESIK